VYKRKEWSDEGYLALSAVNVKKGYIDFNVEAKYGNLDLYTRWMRGNELYKGQVLFTTEAPMGNVAQVPDNKGSVSYTHLTLLTILLV
ncbi:restriction endonuclease subunit S domain-containing protein, partial [Staphylococcus aureus]